MLRRILLAWAFSRARWIQEVCVEVAIGALFFAAPNGTLDALGIVSAAEPAALMRLYGILLMARGLLHHATLGAPERRVVLGSLAADFAFAAPSALVVALAIRQGLAGATAWLVVALFTWESALAAVALGALWSASREDLASALAGAKARRSRTPSGDR
jgi:hypothetical protein